MAGFLAKQLLTLWFIKISVMVANLLKENFTSI